MDYLRVVLSGDSLRFRRASLDVDVVGWHLASQVPAYRY
jgi:hypothetical protein